MEDDETEKAATATDGTAHGAEAKGAGRKSPGAGDSDTSDAGGTSDRAGDEDEADQHAGSKRSVSSRWGNLDEEDNGKQAAAAAAGGGGGGKKRKKQKKGADAAAEGELAAWVQQEYSKIDQQLAELDGGGVGGGVKGILFKGERGSGDKKKVRWPDEPVLGAEPVVGFRIAGPTKQVGWGQQGNGVIAALVRWMHLWSGCLWFSVVCCLTHMHQ